VAALAAYSESSKGDGEEEGHSTTVVLSPASAARRNSESRLQSSSRAFFLFIPPRGGGGGISRPRFDVRLEPRGIIWRSHAGARTQRRGRLTDNTRAARGSSRFEGVLGANAHLVLERLSPLGIDLRRKDRRLGFVRAPDVSTFAWLLVPGGVLGSSVRVGDVARNV